MHLRIVDFLPRNRTIVALQAQALAIKQADGSYTDDFRRLITDFYLFY